MDWTKYKKSSSQKRTISDDILNYLKEHPGWNSTFEIAEAFGKDQSSVSGMLRAMIWRLSSGRSRDRVRVRKEKRFNFWKYENLDEK